MKLLKFELEVTARYAQPVSENHFQLHCIPRRDVVQQPISLQGTVSEEKCVRMEHTDRAGNRYLAAYLAPAHTAISYRLTGLVKVDLSQAALLPAGAPAPMEASSLTATGKQLCRWQASLLQQGAEPMVQAEEIMDLLYQKLRPISSHDAPVGAEAAAQAGQASCEDFAHCMLALCRESGLPARYVTGLLPGRQTLHAWVEVQGSDGVFTGWDPFYGCPVDEEYLRLCQGRDWQDCAVLTPVSPSPAPQSVTVTVHSTPTEEDEPAVLSAPTQVLSLAKRMAFRDYSYQHIPLEKLDKVMNSLEFTFLTRVAEALPEHQPGKRLYVKEIASYLNLPAAKLSPVIGKLEEQGLIEWTNDRNSAGSYVMITDYGRRRLADQQRIQYSFYERVIARFGEEKSNALMHLMMEFEHIMREELDQYSREQEEHHE